MPTAFDRPQHYLDEILRTLPYWPPDRYLDLAPNNWPVTRAKLDPDELNTPRGPGVAMHFAQ